MSLSPSKETVWSQHQESLKNIRGKLKGGRRTKSNSPSIAGSRRYQLHNSSGSGKNQRKTNSYTPPYLPRLDTPPEHDHLRLNSSLRGNKYNIVPPVHPKEAFVNNGDSDSWGEESESEEDAGYTPQVLPFAMPVYPAQPAVVYPGMPGQPYVFYPLSAETPNIKHGRVDRSNTRMPRKKKKVVRFDAVQRYDKPVDTQRMKYSQLHPAYQSLYTNPGAGPRVSGSMSSLHGPRDDPFDENRNPILKRYKYIYPNKSSVRSFEPRSALSDIDGNSQSLVLGKSALEASEQVCGELLSTGVEMLVRELIRETTNELVDDYLDVKLTSHDPLEDFLTQLMNDGVESALQVVVKETLQDLTEDALIFSGSCDVIDDLVWAEIEHTVPDLMEEVTFELLLEGFIEDEVIESEVSQESKLVADEVLQELDNKIRRKELKEVSKYGQEKVIDSVCLDYLLALISRQGTIWSQSDFANRAMDSMMLSLIMEQYFHVQKDRSKTLDNVPLRRLHEKAVTGVALDVFLGQLAATLDEDMADVDEYEWGISLPQPSNQQVTNEHLSIISSSTQ